MASLRLILPALLGVGCLILGFLMGSRSEQVFGNTLFIAGAIIIAGVVIGSAIMESAKRK